MTVSFVLALPCQLQSSSDQGHWLYIGMVMWKGVVHACYNTGRVFVFSSYIL